MSVTLPQSDSRFQRWRELIQQNVPDYMIGRSFMLLVPGLLVLGCAYLETLTASVQLHPLTHWMFVAGVAIFMVAAIDMLRQSTAEQSQIKANTLGQTRLLLLTGASSVALNGFVYLASQVASTQAQLGGDAISLNVIAFVLVLAAGPAAGLRITYAGLVLALNTLLASMYLMDLLSVHYGLQLISGQLITFLLFRTMLSEFQQKSLANHHLAQLLATQRMLKSEVEMATQQRIARDLHDELGHLTTVVNSNLERYLHAHQPPDSSLLETLGLVRQLNIKIRRVSTTLRDAPFDLVAALQTLASGIQHPIIYIHQQDFTNRCPHKTSEAIFRVCQEAVTNCIKHSNANRLDIKLVEAADCYQLVITDNGRNWEKIDHGFGLKSVCSRVNELNGLVDIQVNTRGCLIDIRLPKLC